MNQYQEIFNKSLTNHGKQKTRFYSNVKLINNTIQIHYFVQNALVMDCLLRIVSNVEDHTIQMMDQNV